jgi:hypothetical protein
MTIHPNNPFHTSNLPVPQPAASSNKSSNSLYPKEIGLVEKTAPPAIMDVEIRRSAARRVKRKLPAGGLLLSTCDQHEPSKGVPQMRRKPSQIGPRPHKHASNSICFDDFSSNPNRIKTLADTSASSIHIPNNLPARSYRGRRVPATRYSQPTTRGGPLPGKHNSSVLNILQTIPFVFKILQNWPTRKWFV